MTLIYRQTDPNNASRMTPPRTIVHGKDPPAHLVDAQLVLLSKCVACGLHWTSKKSAKQKRTHIERCAKKNAFTKDTVTFLIQKETAPAVLPTHTTATLMDSVVPAAPVKKPRRQQVVPTVRSLPETRENILHRARDILGPTRVHDDLLSTQQFGRSALARRKSQHPMRPALADANGFSDEPPLTQSFSASSLRAGLLTAERSREQSSSLTTQQFGASMFDQVSILSNDRVGTL